MKAVFLLSGGMDSVTCLHRYKDWYESVVALSVIYGSKHNERELACASRHCKALQVPLRKVDISPAFHGLSSSLLDPSLPLPEGHYADASMRSTVVPFRNGLFLAVAVAYAESLGFDRVVYGAHAGDHAIYPDCRPEFVLAFKEASQLGTYAKVEVVAPFQRLTKHGIVREALAHAVPLGDTWTCYAGGELHCGKCGSCRERLEAFALCGAHDPVPYETNNERPTL